MREDPGWERDDERLVAICGLDDPVRRSLYTFVSSCGEPVSRDVAAAATGIGRPLAAYHLDKLVALGLLTAGYQRPPGRGGPGAGRPAKVYSRSAEEFTISLPPREYELAANLLAHAVQAEASGSAMAELLEAARRSGSRLARTEPTDVLALLRAHGFEPWQQEDGTIVLRNCPFHQLATRYPDVVCGMNLALLDGVVAGAGTSRLRAALDPAPGRCCVVLGAAERDEPVGER